MSEQFLDAINTLTNNIRDNSEFWSAVVGATVGGFIAYLIQIKSLREGRRQRAEDRRYIQHALANSLLFKMIRIHSNFYGISRHIEECFEESTRRKDTAEPWQFVLPLANPPEPVYFSSEEMGMLLALRNDDVFNSIISMDVIHNSLGDAIRALNEERRGLLEKLPADAAQGKVVTSALSKEQFLALRPRMIEVNTLIENIRSRAQQDSKESRAALGSLHSLFRDSLGLSYKLEFSSGGEGESESG